MKVWPRASNAALVQATFKQQPEDFQVIEQLDVADEGAGEHQWLWIRKRGANTRYVAEQLAKFAGVSARQVSFSGMKDRQALTWQWFSIQLPGQPLLDWQGLQHSEFAVEQAIQRSKKLPTGLHKANTFVIRLRDVAAPEAFVERATAVAQQGVPNYFGEQRFGHGGNNFQRASDWLLNGQKRIKKAQRSLWLSTIRSYLFNDVVAARLGLGTNTLLAGDCVRLAGSRSQFSVEQWGAEEQARLAAGDIALTAPLPGSGSWGSDAEALAFEQQALEPHKALLEGLADAGVRADRRVLWLRPEAFTATAEGSDVVLTFRLPSGAFATTFLDELITTENNQHDEHTTE
ncbi:tRNA pseudouridine(13) synthase TruD [Idiomarina tyrosinivorans]|uniref:tRNA pseudouridine synthase D n=1 Tax=Idiomarina tyrosinivorans TaxID=1445662 RepID=A0A432ZRU1_9GAMM|nr:tRNA pseudouridine(13) synthase TruD [Idiomarina tyrosinivorans]RUO80609.1 tRNA pseudouridine(13) synthase TruD [Idiomarina tyrosinivorans]